MKNYIKPEIKTAEITPLYAIANEAGLSAWLEEQQLEKGTNITTFEFGS